MAGTRMGYLLVLLLIVGISKGQDDWQVGPFVKDDSVNPIMEPR
ncbi:unnamed protein product, partial [Allacma fusca]